MKKIITAFVFCFLCGECFSQAGEWVWIKGDSIPNQPGNFGVQGVPSPTNNPPGLYEPCEWTDLNGNFWLFGGYANSGKYGDLWKYDPLINEWIWMKGSGFPNDSGHYGIQGLPSPLNNPPAKGYGMSSWVDNQDNFWMFGGVTDNGNSNDLWKYNISTNEWTWIRGSNVPNQVGIYGIQGIPNSTNNPSSRSECVAAWTDDTGDLWMFGGYTLNDNLNDVWKYNISTNEWTWMKGDSTINSLGNYGTQGIEVSANTPGARRSFSHWKDHTGKLWLFGGGDDDYDYNDLWRYNLSSNNWTWMGGSNSTGATGVYGTKCNISFNNIPGARFENRAALTDQFSNFWLFGGGEGSNFLYSWNDLWMYCYALNQWIWISGDSIPNPIGIWGNLGVSNSLNKPYGRSGAVGWTDHNGHLYFFGGYASPLPELFNDLWKYTIDTTCGVCPNTTSIAENNFTNELLVFPNPTNSSLTISFSSSEKQNIELRIYNTLGKELYFSKQEITKGKFEKEINVEKWSEGIYFLQVKTKEGNLNRKVIINH